MVRRGRVLVTVQFLSLAVLVLIPYARPRSLLTDVVGSILIFLALTILLIAARDLRPALTVMPEPKIGAPFITQGIYKIVRHPMYLGVILIAIGFTLMKVSLIGLIFTAILIVDLKIKYKYEDRLLVEKWPQAKAYQKQVGALFPKIH